MAEQKLPNVFAEPGVEHFVRSACLAPRGGGRAIDIHALECDDEVIAIFAGVADGQRFSMMFNTYTMSEHARYSPGLILMRYIIDHYAERGYRSLDLGIGSDEYKRLFCKDDEPIFDSFVPLTSRGKLAAMAMSCISHGKRLVKQNQMLFDLAQRLRARFAEAILSRPRSSRRHHARPASIALGGLHRPAQHRHVAEADRLELLAHQRARIRRHRRVGHHDGAGIAPSAAPPAGRRHCRRRAARGRRRAAAHRSRASRAATAAGCDRSRDGRP